MRLLRRLTLIALCLLAPHAAASALAGQPACDNRTNNTPKKLLECVTVDGVREHQAVLQAIADAIGSPNFVRSVYDGDGSASGVPGPPGSEAIEALLEGFHADLGLTVEPTAIGGSDDGPFAAAGIPVGGVFAGATGIKTAEQAAIYGGTAGVAYDPCYHLACDTYANVSLEALDLNADAIAYAVLYYAMNAAP